MSLNMHKELAAKLTKLPPDISLEDEDEAYEAADGLGALGWVYQLLPCSY